MKVHDELKTLRASEREELEKLASRRTDPHGIIDVDLARRAGTLASRLGVQLALLIGRDGRVTHVVVGSRDRVYLPDLGRFRLDAARLRRLRLIVFSPTGHARTHRFARSLPELGSDVRKDGSRAQLVDAPIISDDLLTDLEKLRLDALLVILAGEQGELLSLSFAHLRPAPPKAFSQPGHRAIAMYAGRDIHDLKIQFDEFIRDVETQFNVSRSRTFDTSKDRAILVGAYTGKLAEAQYSMDELVELAWTAGVEVLDTVIQRRHTLDPRTVIGKGKIEQLVLQCLDVGAEMLIFDRELSPSQLRNIANITELKILDRSMLILDIFSQRAKTSEGRLQVELAQLRYSLPRLTEKDSGLSRLTGGIGGRGPGETKLEIGRRRARDRIADLERRIDKIADQRGLRRERRQARGVPVVAIVGYTNAGKSTLLNALTKGDVLVENKLFATLDPSSRRMRFPNEKEVIFVDTVGFIRELPKELVSAFRATLEEVGEADLLLHVVDASHFELRKQIDIVTDTLTELGFGEKPRILILNKTDLLSELEAKSLITSLRGIAVSALERIGFEELILRCQEELNQSFSGRDPGGFLDHPPTSFYAATDE